MTETITSNIEKLNIDNTDIFLEDFGSCQGKITISNTWGHNYSMFWGAMSKETTLKEFICSTNEDYFANKLFGHNSGNEMDVKKTFANIRKSIIEDICLPWHKHIEFQKDMRRILNDFQRLMEEGSDERYFVDSFNCNFINRLDFSLINNRYESQSLESDFKSVFSECWYMIATKPNKEYLWLCALHKKLLKQF